MKLALFTSQFPGKVSTFISLDIFAFLQQKMEVDVFPIYPVQSRYWENVPNAYRNAIKEKVGIEFVPPLHFSWRNVDDEIAKDIWAILCESWRYGYLQPLKSLSVIRQAILWAKRFDGKYDYMFAYWGNYAGTYAYIANRLLNNKIPFSFFLHAGTDLYRDRIFLEQKILYANKIITECNFNRDFLHKTYPQSFDAFKEKLIVNQPGVNIDELECKIDGRSANTLLTIGSFFRQKGFATAIEALSLLAGEFEDLELTMIGDGPERSRLRTLAKQLKVEDRINFTGWLPFDEVKNYLEKSTILIHPSCDLGDAVPNVIKEAMAVGLPVIGADIVGIPEALDYGAVGLLFPPKNSVLLADRIKTLLLDSNLRFQLARKAREFAVQNFNIWKANEVLAWHLRDG